MKKILSLLTVCGLFSLAACQPEDAETIEKDFDFGASVTTVNVGETVTFTDYSINVQSRTWTFPDGEPATSSEPVADVVFTTQGTKDVTLTVTYSDGTEDKGNISITVLNSLTAEIQADGLTPKGCAKKGQEITFSLDGVVGSPDSYEWTFPGGTPATSSEASPKVVWNDQINDVEVTCKLTRSSDGATATLTKHIIAGNYPMLVFDEEYNVDVFGFEVGENLDKAWYNWGNFPVNDPSMAAGEYPDLMTVVDGGFNSDKCLRIDLSKGAFNASQMPDCTWILGHRKNWSNNPWLTVGQKYEVSISFKADVDNIAKIAACHWLKVNAWVLDEEDPLRGLNSKVEWSNVFDGDPFEANAEVELFTQDIWLAHIEEDPNAFDLLEPDWKTYTYEFTVPDTLGKSDGEVFKNCYVLTGLVSIGAVIWIDNVQINLIEE